MVHEIHLLSNTNKTIQTTFSLLIISFKRRTRPRVLERSSSGICGWKAQYRNLMKWIPNIKEVFHISHTSSLLIIKDKQSLVPPKRLWQLMLLEYLKYWSNLWGYEIWKGGIVTINISCFQHGLGYRVMMTWLSVPK